MDEENIQHNQNEEISNTTTTPIMDIGQSLQEQLFAVTEASSIDMQFSEADNIIDNQVINLRQGGDPENQNTFQGKFESYDESNQRTEPFHVAKVEKLPSPCNINEQEYEPNKTDSFEVVEPQLPTGQHESFDESNQRTEPFQAATVEKTPPLGNINEAEEYEPHTMDSVEDVEPELPTGQNDTESFTSTEQENPIEEKDSNHHSSTDQNDADNDFDFLNEYGSVKLTTDAEHLASQNFDQSKDKNPLEMEVQNKNESQMPREEDEEEVETEKDQTSETSDIKSPEPFESPRSPIEHDSVDDEKIPVTPDMDAAGSSQSDSADDSPKKGSRLIISDDDEEQQSGEIADYGENKQRQDEIERAETASVDLDTSITGQEKREHEEETEKAPEAEPMREVDSDEENVDAKSEVGELIADIFGESDEEKEANLDNEESKNLDAELEKKRDVDDELKVIGVASDHEDEYERPPDFEWDFDKMLKQKKLENRRQRKRRRDGSIDLLSDADEQIKEMIEAMRAVAKEDRHSNTERKPALQKRKMLLFVVSQLKKADLAEALIDNGVMSVVSEWLAPLPDKSLPALEIRSHLLKILLRYERLEQSVLRQSGLGKAVMLLYKHPRETKENKKMAARLISEWARPIFQLDTDLTALSREERLERDYQHMPQAKKRRISREEDGRLTSKESNDNRMNSGGDMEDAAAGSRPGQKGWVGRARVPRPSTKDYVLRPKSNVEGQFRGPTQSKKTSRYDRKLRELRDKNKAQKGLHAIGISIEGKKMS